MHTVQKKILALARKKNIADMGYRKLGSLVGEEHPQKVKWHLEKLLRDGRLITDFDGQIKPPSKRSTSGSMILVPILGRANCGEPLSLTDEDEMDDAVQVSKSFLPKGREKTCFAVRAIGESMNKASLDGQPINDGDIVLVDSEGREPRDGDYVVAAIDGAATLKRYSFDKKRGRIVLSPESTQKFNPIVINAEDGEGYRLLGRVIDIIPTAV